LLRRQGLTREQLQQSIRAGKQLDKLVARITSGVPDCTDDELRAYYEQHRERYVTPDRAQVRHILIKPASARTEDKAATRSRLQDLKRQAEEGGDFAHLAAAYSECPSGSRAGGSLGWISEGTTVPEFDRVVFDMEIGDISDVFETPLGYHIVEKTDEEAGDALPFEAVADRVRELLTHERRGRALSEYVNKLKTQAVIEDDDPEAGKAGEPDSSLDADDGS
jgi:parvulin-like peptidyl-prolyl isomerase